MMKTVITWFLVLAILILIWMTAWFARINIMEFSYAAGVSIFLFFMVILGVNRDNL